MAGANSSAIEGSWNETAGFRKNRSIDPILAALVVLSVVARSALLTTNAGRPLEDPDGYVALARSLVEGRGFSLRGKPTAYRPPLYALALTPIVALGRDPDRTSRGIRLFHLALGAATAGLTALAAKRMGLSRLGVRIAAGIVAFDPVLVAQARTALTETFAAFWVAAILAALARPGRPTVRSAAIGGFLFGWLALCRPSFLPSAGLVVCAFLGTRPFDPLKSAFRCLVFIVALAAVLAPWAVRNARLFGEPIWTSSHGGYTLAMANNEIYYREVLGGPPNAVWGGRSLFDWRRKITLATQDMTEPEANRHLTAEGWSMLRRHPQTFVRASLARLGRFWAIEPSPAVYPAPFRLAVALWTLPLWLALLAGLLQADSWSTPRVYAVCLILGLSIVHAFYWTDLRMRAPAVPAIGLIAAAGFTTRPRGFAKAQARERSTSKDAY